MSFWKMFKPSNDQDKKEYSQLYYELKSQFPDFSDENLIKITCIAGLFARVAYVDFDLDIKEKEHMKFALTNMTEFSNQEIDSIIEISLSHVKELAGLENHKYVYNLKEVIDKSERFQIVEALFALAASDGVVENIESEEIRIIVKGFDLSDQHFIAARAKASDKLKALRG